MPPPRRPALSGPAVPERRHARRYPYPALVRVEASRPVGEGASQTQIGTGIDISTNGIAVRLPAPHPPGQVVTVTLAGGFGRPDEISTRARVVRAERNCEGFVVGLQFLA